MQKFQVVEEAGNLNNKVEILSEHLCCFRKFVFFWLHNLVDRENLKVSNFIQGLFQLK